MVAVIMTTYEDGVGHRTQYLQDCLNCWVDYAPPEYRYIISDDGSTIPPSFMLPYGRYNRIAGVTGPHNGIGASLNRAMTCLDPGEPWIYTTDDWKLPDGYDDSVNEHINFELAEWLLTQGYDMVRLGPMHPNLICVTKFTQGHGWWLDVDPFNGYAFATRPFLAAPSLVEKIGPFKEGVDAYECEKDYADRIRQYTPDIEIASVVLHGPWEHIGEYEVGDRPIQAKV
jgi:hypothetical protein